MRLLPFRTPRRSVVTGILLALALLAAVPPLPGAAPPASARVLNLPTIVIPDATPAATPAPGVVARPTPAGAVGTPQATPKPTATPKGGKAAKPTPAKGAEPGANAVTAAPGTQTATQQAPAGAGSKRVGGKETPPKLVFPLNALQASLHFSPLDVQVLPGGEFQVTLVLTNRSKRPAEGFDVSLAYDPQWLTFQGYDAEPLAATLGAPSERLILKSSVGRLHFSSLFKYFLTDERAELLRLRFQASPATGRTTLRFLFPPDGITAVYCEGDNLVGNEAQGLRGVLPANIFISDSPDNELVGILDAPSTATIVYQAGEGADPFAPDAPTSSPLRQGWIKPPPGADLDGSAALDLQPPESRTVRVGDAFWVDLILDNPSALPLDALGVRVAFDSDVLEVIDQDPGNWISKGVNAWDGAFHDSYPFDFHRANQATNSQGFLVYQAGRQYGAWPFPTGIFARILFRAKAPAAATRIAIARSQGAARQQTFLRSYGRDRLDEAWRDQAPPAFSMQVLPSRDAARP